MESGKWRVLSEAPKDLAGWGRVAGCGLAKGLRPEADCAAGCVGAVQGGMPREAGGAGWLSDEGARWRSSLNELAKPGCDMPQVCADVIGRG